MATFSTLRTSILAALVRHTSGRLTDPPPAMVRGWAVSIARHRLHRNGPPEHVIADYRDALKQLGDASAGRLVLAGVDGVAAPVADAAGGVHAASDAPVFSRPGAMDGWL